MFWVSLGRVRPPEDVSDAEKSWTYLLGQLGLVVAQLLQQLQDLL